MTNKLLTETNAPATTDPGASSAQSALKAPETPEPMEIEGYWLDPALVLPARSNYTHESVDVLIYLRAGDHMRYTVGHYNHLLIAWITDIGRYPTIACWGYLPKVSQK